MKPFLLITSRDDDAVVLPEVRSYQRLTGLSDSEMVWIRAERSSLVGVNIRDYSGIIVAGSPFTVSQVEEKKTETERRVERELTELLDEVIAADWSFLGVCYGVGALGSRCGAVIDATYGEEVGIAEVSLTDAGKGDPIFRELPPSFDAYVGHKEAVKQLPESCVLLASSETCPVQAFRVGEHVYATQFHPELDAEDLTGRIRAYVNYGYFDPDRVDELIAEISAADVRASQLVLARFIEQYARAATPMGARGER